MSWKYCHFSGCAAIALLEERDRLVRTAWPAGRRFAQEDRAEPVGDREERIQRRRQIEQRLKQLVLPAPIASEPIAAVVLNGPNPVDVRGQRVELERHALTAAPERV